MTAYDNDNIFAKIIRGDIPCHKVYEDEKTFAFMDIMPRTEGHCLVIPKAPSRNLFDIESDDLAAVCETVIKISRAAIKAVGATGITVQQFNEKAGGQEVFHTHFHILPRYDGDKIRPPGQMGDQDQIAAFAERLRAELHSSATN